LERDSIEEILARGESRQIDAGSEIAALDRSGTEQASRAAKLLVVGVLDDETPGAIATAPDDRAFVGHVAAHDAERNPRGARAVARDDGRWRSLCKDLRDPSGGQCGRRRQCLQNAATRQT
jgi:hypothetical protein